MSNAEIAEHLTVNPLTVKTHVNHDMTKLSARDQLVVIANQAGRGPLDLTDLAR
jgi:DNA-binding CsgD family transcriptional regulator